MSYKQLKLLKALQNPLIIKQYGFSFLCIVTAIYSASWITNLKEPNSCGLLSTQSKHAKLQNTALNSPKGFKILDLKVFMFFTMGLNSKYILRLAADS